MTLLTEELATMQTPKCFSTEETAASSLSFCIASHPAAMPNHISCGGWCVCTTWSSTLNMQMLVIFSETQIVVLGTALLPPKERRLKTN